MQLSTGRGAIWFDGVKARLRAVEPRWILLTAWLVAIAYAYPGYMNWDAGEQLDQLRRWRLDDWHPPLMAAYWRLVEMVIRGPFGMLLLQTGLFLWGIYSAFKLRFTPGTSAVLAASIFLYPPVLTPIAVVWKDAQMAAFLIAGTVLALRTPWWSRVAGLVLLMLAAGVRDNGVAALPPLCMLVVASWHVVQRRVAAAVISVALVGILGWSARAANERLTHVHIYPWYKTVAIHDLAGTICREDPMTDEEIRELLTGIPILQGSDLQARFCNAYETRVWFKLTFGGHENNMFTQVPNKPERLARRRAWYRIVRDHTEAYLSHRWALMQELLGMTSSPIWEPVCQTIAANREQLRRVEHDASLSSFQRVVGDLMRDKLGQSLLYRPWAYLLLGLVMLGYAARRRDAWLCALLCSGVLYESSFALGAAAPDYRYSHWMVTCVCIAAATIFVERLRMTRPPDAV